MNTILGIILGAFLGILAAQSGWVEDTKITCDSQFNIVSESTIYFCQIELDK